MPSHPGKKKKSLTQAKAKKMLRHGRVKGKPLTKKQRGKFGAVAGGNANKI